MKRGVFYRLFRQAALAGAALTAPFFANSQATAARPAPVAEEQGLGEWLMRIREASRRRAYSGTFVVSSGNAMASARLWHVCDGSQQVERVETLTGSPRTTLRRNDEVLTYSPDNRQAVWERRESLGLFPSLMQSQAAQLGAFYTLKRLPQPDRVAGFDTEVHDLIPRDSLRFGYRIWSEKKTGLMVKLQTRDAQQQVLEQVAFSDLQLNAPIRLEQMLRQMKVPAGYSVQHHTPQPTTPEQQGWRLKATVPGFAPVSCQVSAQRPGDATGTATMQWVFSDGLASVSVFAEPFDAQRHGAEGESATGATHSYARKHGDFWLTFVGEVPAQALRQFALHIERVR